MELFFDNNPLIFNVNNKYEQFIKNIETSLSKVNISPVQLNGALLCHGSTSSSLLAFTNFMEKQGRLIPLGQLEAQGKIPFSGEIIYGRTKINVDRLSTVLLQNILNAIKYACDIPTKKLSVDEYISNLNEYINTCKGSCSENAIEYLKSVPDYNDNENIQKYVKNPTLIYDNINQFNKDLLKANSSEVSRIVDEYKTTSPYKDIPEFQEVIKHLPTDIHEIDKQLNLNPRAFTSTLGEPFKQNHSGETNKYVNWLYGDLFAIESRQPQTDECNLCIVEAKRLLNVATLDSTELKLILDVFPILYGINPHRTETFDVVEVYSRIQGERGLRNGAYKNEIVSMFVPPDKVEFVRSLVDDAGCTHIAVNGYTFNCSK